MRKDYFSPSLMCGDWLNLQGEIQAYEEARAEMIHFDIMDTTFTPTTMLPPSLVQAVRKATEIPLDIHLMVREPEYFLDNILPWCDGCYISVHAEATKQLREVVRDIREAGAKPSVALNPGTPLCMIEEVAPYLDMALILNGNAGKSTKQDIDSHMERKIRRARELLDTCGNETALIEVDGNISFENALRAKRNGANVYVLGTASIYGKETGVAENIKRLREYLKESEG